jgi:hypothetical protein
MSSLANGSTQNSISSRTCAAVPIGPLLKIGKIDKEFIGLLGGEDFSLSGNGRSGSSKMVSCPHIDPEHRRMDGIWPEPAACGALPA